MKVLINVSIFDIREVIENYELFNIKIGEGINKRLNFLIKEILKKESEINVIADIYVKSIDWRKSNTYELWVILNTLFPEVYPLLEKYRRCFQMITNQNVSNVSEKENNIMSFISYSTYIELKNHILWRPTYNGETQREYDVFDFLVSEIETLFFG